MKKTTEQPTPDTVGIGKRLKIFVEIARHPDGITITYLTHAFHARKENFTNVKHGIGYHVDILVKNGYVTTTHEVRNGNVELVCKATRKGFSVVNKEICGLCQTLKEIVEKGWQNHTE